MVLLPQGAVAERFDVNLGLGLGVMGAAFMVLTPIFALAAVWSGDARFGGTAVVLGVCAFVSALVSGFMSADSEEDTGW